VDQLPVPAQLRYYPFQREGIRFVLDRSGALLADEPGIGKTIQAIGVINAIPELEKILVVCPATLRLNWRRELSKWLVKFRSIGVIGLDQTSAETLFSTCTIIIINYDRLYSNQDILGSLTWDLVILDESHFIKSPGAKRTRVATALKANRRVALSGTPVLNRPAELLLILSWLSPHEWPRSGWHEYELRYCNAYWDGFGWDVSGASNLEELSSRLRTVMLRRTKAEVLPELPAKCRTVIELSPTVEMRTLVKKELDAFRRVAQQQSEQFQASIRKLRVDPQQIDGDNLAIIRHQTAMAKVPLAAEFVREALEGGANKIVIFAHHRDVIKALENALSPWHPVILIGGMGMQERQSSIDTFRTDPKCRIFIGNLVAAGTGITLTASGQVIFAEMSWVPAELTQAEDRCHRIGTRDSVLVQHLVLAGSVDSIMAKTILKKQKILDSLFSVNLRKEHGSPLSGASEVPSNAS
jgi:SWI/SNF-related matrix-associated actin-dependent regulator 1 of chromatin subfamily A